MKLNELARGARQARKRVGRGVGSGLGKTSARGHKGQKARSGGFHKVAFEGGQMPLYRRLPKRGFVSRRHVTYALLNLSDLGRESLAGESVITPDLLLSKRVVSHVRDGIKVLGTGSLARAVEIRAHRFSESAKQKIEAAGGKVVEISARS
jgi:large subunit ribosomal protein L15